MQQIRNVTNVEKAMSNLIVLDVGGQISWAEGGIGIACINSVM